MNPFLINLETFKISSQIFFTLIGLFTFSYLLVHLAKKSRLRLQFFLDNMGLTLLSAIIFGRIFAVIGSYQVYFYELNWTSIYKILAIWIDKEISIIGFIFGIFIFIKRQTFLYQELFSKWADVLSIASLSLLSFHSIGAFLYGANYGRMTDSFLGVTFNSSIVKYTSAVYPTQLFAALYTLIIGAWCLNLFKKYRNKYNGYVFLQAGFLFFTARAIESLFRGDDTIYLFELIRIPGLLSAILAYIFFKANVKYEKEQRIT